MITQIIASTHILLIPYANILSLTDSHLRALIALFLIASPAILNAHPGGLDRQGGHTDSRSGQYHCHRSQCEQAHRKQQQAEQEAREEGRSFSSLYDREAWPHWSDDDRDCQDTRAEMLILRSRKPVTFTNSQQCTVASGEWYDPYTNTVFNNASALDMDHLVPLRHAHGHGGDQWDTRLRQQFANDPDNLLAVSASANRSKGASSPDQWLPDNRAYWCEYGKRWRALKQRYALMITPPEMEALEKLDATCR